MKKGIRLIALDLDDTLWDVEATIGAAEQSLRQWMSDHTPDALSIYGSNQVVEIRNEVLNAFPEKRHDLSLLRTEVLYRSMLRSGIKDVESRALAKQAFSVFFQARNNVAFFPGAQDVLAVLAKQYSLFAVTNGNASIQAVGIGEYFIGAVSSADVGVKKPDPRIFQHVLAQAGCSAEEAVHVGDNLLDDIAGAHSSNLRSVWVNHRGHNRRPEDATPSAEIADLRQLPEAVARLEA